VRLRDRARVAIIGAGPSGIVAAKHALEVGFDVTVFEATGVLGGQWYTTAAHSGVWPGMHTNTSRAMTAFSDFPPPAEHPLHPAAEQILAYLDAYAHAFGVVDHIRFTPVEEVHPGWTVDGERFDAVVLASGRFRKPRLPRIVDAFRGEVIHAFSYVIQKVVDGVSSDWQWYTLFGAIERRLMPPDEWSRRQRERIERVAGNPADFGAPEPSRDVRVAGLSLCQDYLAQVRDDSVVCRPGIASVQGRTVTFTDGSTETVDAIICATGYDVDVPYLTEDVSRVIGGDLALYQRTFNPDLWGLGVIGQFLAQGPYFPLLELQARWIAAVWSGAVALPDETVMRHALAQPRPPLDAHNALALTLSEELGVAPEPVDWQDLCEPLLFGPMLPPRYRLSGPGALPNARLAFAQQLAASPRAPVEPIDVDALREMGWDAAAAKVAASRTATARGYAPRGGPTEPQERHSFLGCAVSSARAW
jgi:dimethylaniline monooxygenase (N-oxide forming)